MKINDQTITLYMDELKSLQAKLIESEKREKELSSRVEELSDFIENASLPLHWVNAEGVIIWANQVELDSLGYTKEEYIGHSITDFHAESEVISDILTRLVNNETLQNYPAKLKCKDGTIKHVLINSNVYRKNGKFQHTRCFTRDITDLKKEEFRKEKLVAELQEKNNIIEENGNQLSKLFMQSPFAITIIEGSEFIIELANEKALELWDRTRAQVQNKKVFEVFPELLEQGFKQILENIYQTGIAFVSNETPLKLSRHGVLSEAYINFVYEPIRDIDGNINKIMGVGIEITDQVMARQKIEEAESRSRLAIEAADMGAFDWDLLQHNFYSSPRLIEIFGFGNNKDTTHADLISTFHPDDKPIRDKAVADARSKGSLVYEARIIWNDKSIHWVRVYGKIIHSDEKEPLRMYGIVTDITQQKEAEEKLKISEERLRMAIEATKLGTWDYQPLTGELNWSEECKKIYAIPTDAEINIDVFGEQIYYEDKDFVDKELEKSMNPAGDGNYDITFRIHRFDDRSVRWIRSQGKVYFNAEQKPERFIGTVIDITEDKEHELKLLESNIQLSRTNADLDSFIYTASHDLKAPVSNLEGLFHTLLSEIDLKDDLILLKDMINSSFERFKTTINDLTEITKIQRAQEPNLESVKLEDLFGETILDIQDQINKSDAMIRTNFQVDEINFSRKNARSIFYNLISNAIKYRSPDRQPLITVSSYLKDEFIVIEVSDNGLGLTQENIKKIFGMFKRVHDHVEGSGIGLYIVKRIINNAGGDIIVESEIDKGSTFKVYLKRENS